MQHFNADRITHLNVQQVLLQCYLIVFSASKGRKRTATSFNLCCISKDLHFIQLYKLLCASCIYINYINIHQNGQCNPINSYIETAHEKKTLQNVYPLLSFFAMAFNAFKTSLHKLNDDTLLPTQFVRNQMKRQKMNSSNHDNCTVEILKNAHNINFCSSFSQEFTKRWLDTLFVHLCNKQLSEWQSVHQSHRLNATKISTQIVFSETACVGYFS